MLLDRGEQTLRSDEFGREKAQADRNDDDGRTGQHDHGDADGEDGPAEDEHDEPARVPQGAFDDSRA